MRGTLEGKRPLSRYHEMLNSFEAQKAQFLFSAAVVGDSAPYDVTSDGKRFVIITFGKRNESFTLVVNWTAELKR